MADTKAQLTASPAFHHLVARRWRVSLLLTACLFVLYYGYILLIAVNKPLLAERMGGDDAYRHSTRCGGHRRVVDPDGRLHRVGEPPLRSRSAAPAGHAPDASLTARHAARTRHITREPDGFGRRIFSVHCRADARHHVVGRASNAVDERVLRRRPFRLGARKRPGARRRLHERGVVSRHRRPRRPAWVRRHDLRDGLAGRLAGAHVPHRRAGAQPGQVHLCRRRGVSPPAGAGAYRVGFWRHPHGALLHHRADGRRRQPDSAAVRHSLRVGGHGRRHRHARLRALRRDDRDDVGADYQGRAAACRGLDPHRARARALRLLALASCTARCRPATVRRPSSLADSSPIRWTRYPSGLR